MLEADGYDVPIMTKGEWVVQTPAREKIMFKWDIGVCRGMLYIDLREHMDGTALI